MRRIGRKMRQEDLAKLSGVTHSTISYIENMHRGVHLSTAILIAVALEVSLDWLATGRGEK